MTAVLLRKGSLDTDTVQRGNCGDARADAHLQGRPRPGPTLTSLRGSQRC